MPVRLCAHSVIHPGNDGSAKMMQTMGYALNRHGFDERIGKNNFIRSRRGRIAFVSSLDVSAQQFPHARQRAAEVLHDRRRASGRLVWVANSHALAHLIGQARHNSRHPLGGHVS